MSPKFSKFSGLALALITLAVGSAHAGLELPCLFGNHMVFQAGKPAVIWGKDKPGQKITITLGDQTGSTRANLLGRWKVSLPLPAPGPALGMTVTGSSTKVFQDILVGEVWLASGQSNMEFRMDQTNDADKAIAQANDGQIRLFLQKPVMSPKPLDSPEGIWKVCSPETVKDFSAVAYYFGKGLREKLKVPVGLIATSWGGSYAESWIPEKALHKGGAFKPVWDRWNKLSSKEKASWQKGRFPVNLAVRNLRFIPTNSGQAPLAPLSQGQPNPGSRLEASTQVPLTIQALNVSAPTTATLPPGTWSWSVKVGSDAAVKISSHIPRMTGEFLTDAWGFMTTSLSASSKGQDLSAYHAIEFETKGDGKYILFLSQPSITDWDNYRTPSVFPVTNQWVKHRIEFTDLKQSGWGKPQPFTADALSNLSFGVDPKPLIEIPSALYNGMINPFVPFPLKGFLWYQGEANTVHADEYEKLLNTLISSWGQAWGDPNMPFILAQLPNYLPTAGQGGGYWSDIREIQRRVAQQPHRAMAVLLDLGDSHDIHPKDKADPGYRLCQAALETAYGKTDTVLSPLFDHAVVENGKVRVYFWQADEGLVGNGDILVGFELAGADGNFQPAHARIDKDTVVVWKEGLTSPSAVRYAWGDDPVFNLLGKNGMPASPFKAELKP